MSILIFQGALKALQHRQPGHGTALIARSLRQQLDLRCRKALQPLAQLRFQPLAAAGRAGLQGVAFQHRGLRSRPIAPLLQVDARDHSSQLRPQARGREAQAVAGRLRRCAGQ